MAKQFEIFTTESAMNTKCASIDALLSYPDTTTKTTMYRCGIEKYQGTDWAGCVDDILVSACENMTPEQRAVYYDDSDLKTYQWLVDNDWFEPL